MPDESIITFNEYVINQVFFFNFVSHKNRDRFLRMSYDMLWTYSQVRDFYFFSPNDLFSVHFFLYLFEVSVVKAGNAISYRLVTALESSFYKRPNLGEA